MLFGAYNAPNPSLSHLSHFLQVCIRKSPCNTMYNFTPHTHTRFIPPFFAHLFSLAHVIVYTVFADLVCPLWRETFTIPGTE